MAKNLIYKISLFTLHVAKDTVCLLSKVFYFCPGATMLMLVRGQEVVWDLWFKEAMFVTWKLRFDADSCTDITVASML